MNNAQKQFFKDLDPQGVDGTIQALLMREDLRAVSLVDALVAVVKQLSIDKRALVKNNIDLCVQLMGSNDGV